MIVYRRLINMVPGGQVAVVNMSQYDSDVTLEFELYASEGTFVVQDGTTVLIRGTKPDGNGISLDGTLESTQDPETGQYVHLVTVEVTHGNHDALYALLRNGELDIVLNDQRRAFSDEYVNIVLDIREYYAEISTNSPIAQLDEVEISDLKNTPLILLSSPDQQETERSFYANDLGFQSEIYFTE